MVLYPLLLLAVGNAVCIPVSNEYADSDRAMQNLDLFEGDIVGIDPNADRNAIPYPSLLWPDGVIPYVIFPELKPYEDKIKRAMEHIENNTCIKFRPVTREDPVNIEIFKGYGCYSAVGMLTQDQPLSLGEGCHHHSIIVHELLHAVGFFHEHSRSDRDDYIEIHWENVDPSGRSQFMKLKPDENILFDSFDFNSIMLYSDTVFSRDPLSGLKTMSSKKPGVTIPDVYTKPGMSKSDIYRVKQLYKCK